MFVFAFIVTNDYCSEHLPGNKDRGQAAHYQRRMIFNNDGDDAWLAEASFTKEGFLSIWLDHIGNSGVNSRFARENVPSVLTFAAPFMATSLTSREIDSAVLRF